ncbi:hypothetical protein KI809_18790 [Geobacter pelophilus]|uniref:Holin n=1 Tax=Geoanaerobacter pelophilus TaxID=60036 RepID=A0AAW4L930_9BACT|nr:hypothetical protein [Geoanaerobacter pelophilus]MBT0666360.1 hypothetical protein [Geoanaerobacter pelophilus]
MIKAFFSWLGGVFSDPNDQQGSTKRLCLFLFLGTIMLLISAVTIMSKPTALPAVPDSILNLVYFIVGTLTGSIVADKGIAAYKAVKGVTDGTSDKTA